MFVGGGMKSFLKKNKTLKTFFQFISKTKIRQAVDINKTINEIF